MNPQRKALDQQGSHHQPHRIFRRASSGACGNIKMLVIYPSRQVEKFSLRELERKPEVSDQGLVGCREEVSWNVRVSGTERESRRRRYCGLIRSDGRNFECRIICRLRQYYFSFVQNEPERCEQDANPPPLHEHLLSISVSIDDVRSETGLIVLRGDLLPEGLSDNSRRQHRTAERYARFAVLREANWFA